MPPIVIIDLKGEYALFHTVREEVRKQAEREGRTLDCLHCGAPLDGALAHCSHCTGALVVVDLPRLAQALHLGGDGSGMRAGLPRAQLAAAPDLGERPMWQCHACGAALNPTQASQCPQCNHPVLVPALADLVPLLDEAERQLRETRSRTARAEQVLSAWGRGPAATSFEPPPPWRRPGGGPGAVLVRALMWVLRTFGTRQ